MNDILSKVSGQLDRSLAFGTLLPVLLFVAGLRLLVVPRLPEWWPPRQAFVILATEWKVAVVATVTIVLTGILFSVSSFVRQLYRGDFWMKTFVGRWRCGWHQRRLAGATARRLTIRYLVRHLRRSQPGDPRLQTLIDYQRELSLRVNTEYPKPESVLPTGFGNALRSVDAYPSLRYGISGASMFPRLLAVLDKDYAATIEDSKRELDFMLNCSLLAFLLAAALAAAGGFSPHPWSSLSLAWPWIVEILSMVLIGILCYFGAIDRAKVWGTKIRGAFDLYRWKLLELLGYKEMPTTLAEERDLWKAISLFAIHGDPPKGKDTGRLGIYDPKDPPKAAATRVEEGEDDFRLCRSVKFSRRKLEVVLEVENTSSEEKTPVTVVDTVAEGFDLVQGSARLAGQPMKISGVNPYYFKIDKLSARQEVEIRYKVRHRESPGASRDRSV